MTKATRSHEDETINISPINPNGLKIDPIFCPEIIKDPFKTVAWELRSAEIKDDQGNPLFEQHDCEIPSTWSQLATNVVVNKYFYGEINTKQREASVKQLIHRVTRSITDWGQQDDYFATPKDSENFYKELTWLCLHQHGAFNSPVWFNVGLYQYYGAGKKSLSSNWVYDSETNKTFHPDSPYEFPQSSACFIQSVKDNMDSIMELAASEAKLFKFGSGTGTDLSTLRSTYEKLSGGGSPSGPLSFLRVYDQIAGVIKSGGVTRRAAKMNTLNTSHPDIMEFIHCKYSEEKKAHALIAAGYESNFNGEAYSTVSFQNANLSVRVSKNFMQDVLDDKVWTTTFVSDPNQNGPTYQAKDILKEMATCAWHCGDPGIQYADTISSWHTCPQTAPINSSNPCSEYLFLDDTACNLSSINLMKFRKDDGSFDIDRFKQAVKIFFIAQEILVGRSSYPTKKIAKNSVQFRPLGLGYSNLGAFLMSNGLPYDSKEARQTCSSITSLMHGQALLTSTDLAKAVGPFEGYPVNQESFLGVMKKHQDANTKTEASPKFEEVLTELWREVLEQGRDHGFRNAQATVLAPTGTISFMMDCDTTGIEPDIALVKYKSLAGRGMLKLVNKTVGMALQNLGYSKMQEAEIVKYIEEFDTIESCPILKPEDLEVFDCAFAPAQGKRSISWRGHTRMMAAAQPFISGAISKTINLPADATIEDIVDVYVAGWRLGLKAIAVYRDGCKMSQPLNTSKEENNSEDTEVSTRPRRECLPDTRQSITHKFDISGNEGYITAGLYPDGRPGELFIIMAKEGSTIGGLMDSFGTAISICLQYGVPLKVLANKFSHTRFEPMGFTSNPDIPMAKSLIDYIFRWLESVFVSKDADPSELENPPSEITSNENATNEQFANFQSDAPSCSNCGAIAVRSGNCYLCYNCGNSLGCS